MGTAGVKVPGSTLLRFSYLFIIFVSLYTVSYHGWMYLQPYSITIASCLPPNSGNQSFQKQQKYTSPILVQSPIVVQV